MLSFLTYAKERGEHARYSVPKNFGLLRSDDEFVFVDYSDDDEVWRTLRLTLDSRFQVVHVPKAEWWEMSRARNCAARAAFGDVLVFCDIDMVISREVLDVCRRASLGRFFTLSPGPGRAGFCAVALQAFRDVGGFEEAIVGYGCSDWDFYSRLQALGLQRCEMDLPVECVVWGSHRRVIVPTDAQGATELNISILQALRVVSKTRGNIGRNYGIGWFYGPRGVKVREQV